MRFNITMDQINIRTVYTFAIACILSLCYAVYLPILGHDFINGWDDQWQVINEYTYRIGEQTGLRSSPVN
jgi:hypothetical protein